MLQYLGANKHNQVNQNQLNISSAIKKSSMFISAIYKNAFGVKLSKYIWNQD